MRRIESENAVLNGDLGHRRYRRRRGYGMSASTSIRDVGMCKQSSFIINQFQISKGEDDREGLELGTRHIYKANKSVYSS